jgi:hypothetical protein
VLFSKQKKSLSRDIFCIYHFSIICFYVNIWDTIVPNFRNSKNQYFSRGCLSKRNVLVFTLFFLRRPVWEKCTVIIVLDTLCPMLKWKKVHNSPEVVSLRETFLFHNFSTICCLGDTRLCIISLDTPVPNFLNRKMSIIFLGLSL